MSVIKPASSFPLLDPGDIVNLQQVGWWFAGEGSGTKLNNVANPAKFNGTLQAGISWTNDSFGRSTTGTGAANSYIDLGTLPLLTNTSAYTILWLETLTAAPGVGLYSILTHLPSGGAQRFIIYRTDSSAAYAPITMGVGNTVNAYRWPSAPTVASGVGKTRVWILAAQSVNAVPGGSNPTALFVDGVSYGGGVGGVGNNIPNTLTANQNYLGWGGSSGANWPGGIHGVRVWNRLLSLQEFYRLSANPFAGLQRPRLWPAGAAAAPLYRMFNAM